MLISVDLGYGYVKAIEGEKRVIFPSVLAHGANEKLLDLAENEVGHSVSMSFSRELNTEYLVGELAVEAGRAIQGGLARDKHLQDNSIIFALTAAYLLGANGDTELALGLPIAFYQAQKEQVIKMFEGLEVEVSVGYKEKRKIKIIKVDVFPQGVGALFASGVNLPKKGIVGIVDVGFNTTDYLLVDCDDGNIRPIPTFAGSIENGASTALKIFATEFTKETSITPPLSYVQQNLWGKDTSVIRGKTIDLQAMRERAVRQVAYAIADSLSTYWSEKIDFLDKLVFCGGGALDMALGIYEKFPQAFLDPDAQFTNARGFYRLANIFKKEKDVKPKTDRRENKIM